jgi:hypothetical protein
MTSLLPSAVRAIAARFPSVVPHLKGLAAWMAVKPTAYKTYDFYLDTLTRMITNVYNNQLGGEFIDIMSSLVQGQLTQAFQQAWMDEDGRGDMPDYLTGALEEMILGQYEHVDQLYRDIVDARVDETALEPLLARAPLWANRWTEGYNQAVHLITMENGGNEEWVLGETEQHCETCAALNGIVARASEWDELGVHPQGGPNPLLACDGWQCDCSRQQTDKRRSPKAYESIMNIVQKG